MNLPDNIQTNHGQIIIRKCHICGTVMESSEELRKCTSCNKSFLPLNYFRKVHAPNEESFFEMFLPGSELVEEDLIRGIYVLW